MGYDTNGTSIKHGDLCLFWDKECVINDTEATTKVKGKFDRYVTNCYDRGESGYRVIGQLEQGLPFDCCMKI